MVTPQKAERVPSITGGRRTTRTEPRIPDENVQPSTISSANGFESLSVIRSQPVNFGASSPNPSLHDLLWFGIPTQQSYHSFLTNANPRDINDDNHTDISMIASTSQVLPTEEEQGGDLFPSLQAGRSFLGDGSTSFTSHRSYGLEQIIQEAINLTSSDSADQDDQSGDDVHIFSTHQRTTPGTGDEEASNDQDLPPKQ